MSKGILSRFIIEIHLYIDEPKVWRYGVILTYQNTHAEVIETYNNREILIKIEGKNKRNLLTLITAKFDEINGSYDNIKVNKLIPYNCQKFKIQQQQHFFILGKLRERLSYKKMTIPAFLTNNS